MVLSPTSTYRTQHYSCSLQRLLPRQILRTYLKTFWILQLVKPTKRRSKTTIASTRLATRCWWYNILSNMQKNIQESIQNNSRKVYFAMTILMMIIGLLGHFVSSIFGVVLVLILKRGLLDLCVLLVILPNIAFCLAKVFYNHFYNTPNTNLYSNQCKGL